MSRLVLPDNDIIVPRRGRGEIVGHAVVGGGTSGPAPAGWDTSFNTALLYSAAPYRVATHDSPTNNSQIARAISSMARTIGSGDWIAGFEVVFDASINDTNIEAGICKTTVTSTGSLTSNAGGWCINGSGQKGHNFAAGSIGLSAINLGVRLMVVVQSFNGNSTGGYIWLGQNGIWGNSSTPVAGAPIYSDVNGVIYPAARLFNAGKVATICLEAANQVHLPGFGIPAWNG